MEGIDFTHDVFRWSGLNKTGAQVWAHLVDRGQARESDLVIVTGRPLPTVHKKLMTMYRLGLAVPLGDGLWEPAGDADLDAAARELGTAGTGDRQRQKHRAERELHRRELEREPEGGPGRIRRTMSRGGF